MATLSPENDICQSWSGDGEQTEEYSIYAKCTVFTVLSVPYLLCLVYRIYGA